MADYNNDVVVDDGENYRNRKLSIKDIALEQFRRCCVEGSTTLIKTDKLDQKAVFINCVEMLYTILYPQISKMKLYTDKFKEEELQSESIIKEMKRKGNTEELKMQLLKIKQDKLLLLSLVLNDLSYFDEEGVSIGFDDETV